MSLPAEARTPSLMADGPACNSFFDGPGRAKRVKVC